MARHDYDLPPDYQKRVEEGTMAEWYKKARLRRRSMKQETPYFNAVEKAANRRDRKLEAESTEKKLKKLAGELDEADGGDVEITAEHIVEELEEIIENIDNE